MADPLRLTSTPDPEPEPAKDRPSRIVVFIEAMTEEQVAFLAEDLVDVLMRWTHRHNPRVASEPP
jgi:hypothetical protein